MTTKALFSLAISLFAGEWQAAALPASSPVSPYTPPDYSAFTKSKFLTYANNASNHNWTNAPTLSISVNNYPLTATMDTGSTGIVIDAKYGFNASQLSKTCQIGHILYTSSNWLQEGYWCTTDVNIGGVVASALALVRTNATCCPDFNATTDGDRCKNPVDSCVCAGGCATSATRRNLSPGEPDSAFMARRQAVGSAYMGVGFARGNSTAAYNLFMNVKSIDGVAVDSTYRQGYVVTSTGVQLGITKASTVGFKAAKLALKPGSAAGSRNWDQPTAAVKIGSGNWINGTFLADTGIPNAYVLGDVAQKSGDEISIAVPGTTNPFGEVQFSAVPKANAGSLGTKNPVQPTWVGNRTAIGVNTGRKFYNKYDLLFDADGGYFGLREKSS
ncbi:hypothetical protein ABW21_db0207013 [Orbilia brochopaga]|nr:hypothetical protein ABW21_db0207013 [Drechslerella brochopaga]